jgi:hypothetical protein
MRSVATKSCALPLAARQYRDQNAKGFGRNIIEAGRARVAIRQLVGEAITLRPSRDRRHLVAHLQFQRMALLGERRVVGSGGAIWSHSRGVVCFSDTPLPWGRRKKRLAEAVHLASDGGNTFWIYRSAAILGTRCVLLARL